MSIFDQNLQDFRFREGPIFTQILLADEVNRASPRTQSALLEAMAENQVSLEGAKHHLDSLFFVIATQNPVEFHGTYPLPEAQMDRFAMRFSLGYVNAADELSILNSQQSGHPIDLLEPCATTEDIRQVRDVVTRVAISEELKRYCGSRFSHPNLPGHQDGREPTGRIDADEMLQALALPAVTSSRLKLFNPWPCRLSLIG